MKFLRKFGACQKLEPAGRIGDFGNFWTVSLIKSARLLRWSWILNECNLPWKIVKYCILYEVCMIKTATHSTLSPQMWCIKKMKGLHAPRVIGKNLQTCRTQKIRPDLFSKNLFSTPYLLWSRAITALKCDRRLFFGCTQKAISTRYKICFTPKSLSFSLKSHMNVLLS